MPVSYSAYTPLESLLLFQALRAEGLQPSSFNKISEQLKSIPLVCNEPRYDPGRLSPDGLRELYLGLLKEEVKEDLERQLNGDNNLTNGDVTPGSRKRKAPSPSLPTVKEAAQHSHLIPQLVTRLYIRYRDQVRDLARPLERQYAEVKERPEEVVAAKQDESLQKKRPDSQTQSPRPSPKPSSNAHTKPVVARADNVQTTNSAAASPVSTPDQPGKEPAKRYSQAKIDAVINHGPEPQDSPGGHRRASSNTSLPPLSEMAPQSPRLGIPPKVPAPAPAQAYPPMQPMPPGANHGYTHSPPAGHQSPYALQHGHPRSGSIPSPQVQQSLSRPSSSPRLLPPPKGMPLQPQPHPGSPGMHGPPGPPMAHQPPPHHQSPQPHYQQYPPQPLPQHRVPSGPPPEGHPRYPNTPVPPQPGYYPQQQYVDRRTSYPQHVQPYPNQPPPQQGGYMLPPFQVAQQDPTKQLQQIRPHPTPTNAQRPQPYMPHVHNTPATAPRPTHLPPRQVSDVLSALATPPRAKVRPLWKTQYRPSPLQASAEKPRPQIEPLSPTLERAKSPVRSTRSTRGRDAPAAEETLQPEAASKSRSSKRRANARDKSPHSVVSSTADESLRATRSQSVSTAAGMNPASDDRPGSRNGVKAEPSTPANMLEDTEMHAPSATPASGMMTRKRRGTVQSQTQPPAKRKRQESPAAPPEEHDMSTPPPRSTTIVATRNFAKMSSAIMNDITSHKHASYFAKEVRDKDAPGYSDIVKHPQNLKSIRTAITAGGKAIAAASTADSPSAGTPNTTSTIVELERTAELIPPKAIVNGAQLEKELMRMFANAYMFNPGEDGMALSTKEMFEDVAQKINDWRGTERDAGVDEEEEGKGKRRKV